MRGQWRSVYIATRTAEASDLLDDDSLTTTLEADVAGIIVGLLSYGDVEVTHLHMNKIGNPPPSGCPAPTSEVIVSDTSGKTGWAAFPGPSYGYRMFDADGEWCESGSLSPGVQMEQSAFARLYSELPGDTPAPLPEAEENRALLLAEIARAIRTDIVISETTANGRRDVYAYHRANTFTRAESIPVIAHYLRIQHKYLTDPARHASINRRGFYQESVAALAPHIWHWLAKCERAATVLPPALVYLEECRAMIGRLLRTLKVKDEFIFYLGSHQSHEVMDDAADCMDRILVSLCGAVDVAARSMHKALQVNGNDFTAKLHNTDWYKKKFRPTYAHVSSIDELDALQARLTVVFELRNTIHSLALEAMGSIGPTVNFFKEDRGRLNVRIPERSATAMRNGMGGLARWGAREIGQHVIADAATMVNACIRSVFEFLDHLCAIVSFEQIWDRDKVLQENIISAGSALGPEHQKILRKLLGGSIALTAPSK
jgi:hypothetical protein